MARPTVPAAAVAMVVLASCSMVQAGEPAEIGEIAGGSELQTQTPDVPAEREFTIVATGDVLLHPPLWDRARADAADQGADAMDFVPQLASIASIVGFADLSICHLETPLAPDGGPYAGYPRFAAPPQIVPALAETGYTACTLASNHTFDQGGDGVDRTLDALDSADVASAGAVRTEADDAPTLIEVTTEAGPVVVGLVSYTFSFNGIPFPDGETWRSNLVDQVRFTFTEDLADGDFTTSAAEYLPVYQTYDDPRRVVDLPAELEAAEPLEEHDRLQVAFDRTTEVVGGRGALDDGLTLLTE